jgi:hypothetical protein
MDFNEYTWFVSSYRSTDLGYVEFKILQYFIENRSTFSVYQLFKLFRQEWETKDVTTNTGKHLTRMPASYKNTHKRVKRLSQLKLIEEIKGDYNRGAIHYRISTYGRIAYLANFTSEGSNYITDNKSDIVIQQLLFQFFEDETIDSFASLKEFPTIDIGDYLHDCCSITSNVCKKFWNEIKQYQIDDILPCDEIIQKYMSYLDGKHVDRCVLDEIKEYENRLLRRYQGNDSDKSNDVFRKKVLAQAVYSYNYDYFKAPNRWSHLARIGMYADQIPNIRNCIGVYAEEKPPFPLLDIYYNIVYGLRMELETRTKSLAINLLTHLGEIVNSEKIETKEQLEDEILESGRDYSLRHILADRKFFGLVAMVKKDFDIGFKQFSYY